MLLLKHLITQILSQRSINYLLIITCKYKKSTLLHEMATSTTASSRPLVGPVVVYSYFCTYNPLKFQARSPWAHTSAIPLGK